MTDQLQNQGLIQTPFTFYGAHSRSVDTKGRFNLPLQFRVATEDKYMVSLGVDGVMTLSPLSVWTANFNRLRALPPSEKLRGFLREMSQEAKLVEPDQQGRVAVTAEYLSKVGIGRKVSIIGMGNYMELWSPDALEQLNENKPALDPDLLNEFYR